MADRLVVADASPLIGRAMASQFHVLGALGLFSRPLHSRMLLAVLRKLAEHLREGIVTRRH